MEYRTYNQRFKPLHKEPILIKAFSIDFLIGIFKYKNRTPVRKNMGITGKSEVN